MNKLFLLAVLGLTTSTAFAQRCQVDLVDNFGRLIQSYSSHDGYDGCKEGMKACRLEIRQRNLVGRADCIRDNDRRPVPVPVPVPGPRPTPNPYPVPNPYPNPYPTPVPTPVPVPSRDAQRHIQVGEKVIMNTSYYTVLGTSMNGLYALRNDWSQISNGVRRENIAVTNGCNLGLCVGDKVINISSLSYVTLAALEFDDRFVTRNDWSQLSANVDRSKLAETKGCVQSYYSQVCVGNKVIDRSNQYMTVVGIQLDGRVVLRNDWSQLKANVDTANLVITR